MNGIVIIPFGFIIIAYLIMGVLGGAIACEAVDVLGKILCLLAFIMGPILATLGVYYTLKMFAGRSNQKEYLFGNIFWVAIGLLMFAGGASELFDDHWFMHNVPHTVVKEAGWWFWKHSFTANESVYERNLLGIARDVLLWIGKWGLILTVPICIVELCIRKK